jgi:hypothetical protein
MVFSADAFGVWLSEHLAVAARGRLRPGERPFGSEQERAALRAAGTAAITRTARELRPDGPDEEVNHLARALNEAFRSRVPAARLKGDTTILQALQAGITAQLTESSDPPSTGTDQSSAQVLGLSAETVAETLIRNAIQEIRSRGADGGPLAPLVTHLRPLHRRERILEWLKRADRFWFGLGVTGISASLAVLVAVMDPSNLGIPERYLAQVVIYAGVIGTFAFSVFCVLLGLRVPFPRIRLWDSVRLTARAILIVAFSASVVLVPLDMIWPLCLPGAHTVRGAIGSEKKALFEDRQVQRVFRENCVPVQALTFGSVQMDEIDLSSVPSGYDFVFPGSSLTAERFQHDRPTRTVYEPFSSPMAIATFKGIPELLATERITNLDRGIWWFDVEEYLAKYFAKAGNWRWDKVPSSHWDKIPSWRWNEIPNNTIHDYDKSVLVRTADPRDSNSAVMYLAIVSNVLNKNDPVGGSAARQRVMARVTHLFLRQGYSQRSAEGPFEDYRTYGISKAPMVFIYQAQFLSHLRRATGEINPNEMILMYPKPTIDSKHTLIPLTDRGDRVGNLLSTNPTLRAREAAFGFRPTDLDVPPDRISVPDTKQLTFADPLTFESLVEMLKELNDRYGVPPQEPRG